MKHKPADESREMRRQSYFVKAIRIPVQTFIHTEEVGAIVLLLAAGGALGWANSPWSDSYASFWHTTISFDIYIFAISEDLEHIVNDGLMAVFFFVVGLEIKRELLHGELSSFRRAVLPAMAAVGGMVAPALIYLAFNGSGETTTGWGIPIATDIAFALGVLALLGRRLPAELRIFLLGLAVVDDLGAIAVIAVFYTEAIHWTDLGLALGVFAVIAACIRIGIRSLGFYFILSVVMWQFFLESGIHATVAGVLLSALTPAEPYLHRKDYKTAVAALLHDFELAMEKGDEEKAESIVAEVEKLSQGTEGPMERLERVIHPWTSFVVLPIFALANAGIVISWDSLTEAAASPITLGILVALPAGNALGIFGMTWLTVRLGLGRLPPSVTWSQVLGVGMLGGIGFTVSIFVSGIAFQDHALGDQAKIGVFGASLLAGAAGYLFLRFVGARSQSGEDERP